MRSISFCALLLGCGSAGAGPVSASRYIDAQGIEIIHNRSAPAARASVQAEVPPPAPAGTMDDPRLRISIVEQNMRDRDRLGILQQEFDTEAGKYAAAWKRVQLATSDNVTAAQLQRLKEQLHEHQTNIQALEAELRRARSGR